MSSYLPNSQHCVAAFYGQRALKKKSTARSTFIFLSAAQSEAIHCLAPCGRQLNVMRYLRDISIMFANKKKIGKGALLH